MKKQLKLLSLAAALCGAVACSSGGGSTTTTGGPGTTGSVAGSSTGTAAGASGTASGGSPTGTAGGVTGTAAGGSGTGTGGNSSTGGGSTGTPGPSTYPCVDGGPPYQPTNPPNSLPFCWCNPGDAGALSYYQIINSCPPSNSTPDLTIPLPPPQGGESITGLAAADLPLLPDAGLPGFEPDAGP